MSSELPAGFFGARFSLYPMTERYVPLILAALSELRDGLDVETDDMSTFVGGHRDDIFAGLEKVFAHAAASGEHVAMSLLLSHGCPGEEVCDPNQAPATPERAAAARAGSTGIPVSCQWSLYPLGVPDYMQTIYGAIETTKAAGVHHAARHFVSHLRGDLSEVLLAIRRSFDAACGTSGHVTAHITLSANSPTRPDGTVT